MSIDTDTAAKIAKLARIKIAEDRLPDLAKEFRTIVEFIQQLNEVDISNVDPMVCVTPMPLKQRDDVVTDGNKQQDILANAPQSREGFFVVPKVVE